MTKTAKFLVIGALAVLFSVCVLFETASEKRTPLALSSAKSPLEPGISTSGTQVVEKSGMTVPDVIIEAELEPEPRPVQPPESVETVENPEEPAPERLSSSAPVKSTKQSTGSESRSVELRPRGGLKMERKPRVYIARKDDSFWKIARRVYGSGAKWRKIWEANRDICPRPGDLRPGMKLVLPEDVPAERLAAVTQKPSVKPRPTPGHYYIIKQGDILGRIAKMAYGRSVFWRRIYERNREQIPDPKMLRPGTRIFIPRIGD